MGTQMTTLVQTFVLENQMLSLQRNAVPQQIFACALAMEVGKPVIAQLEHNSATFRRINWDMVAILAKVPLTVMFLSVVKTCQQQLLKLAVLGTATSVRWMDAVKTLTPLAHIE